MKEKKDFPTELINELPLNLTPKKPEAPKSIVPKTKEEIAKGVTNDVSEIELPLFGENNKKKSSINNRRKNNP